MTEESIRPQEGSVRVYVHFRSKPTLQRLRAMKRAGIVVRYKWTPYLLKGVLYSTDDILGSLANLFEELAYLVVRSFRPDPIISA